MSGEKMSLADIINMRGKEMSLADIIERLEYLREEINIILESLRIIKESTRGDELKVSGILKETTPEDPRLSLIAKQIASKLNNVASDDRIFDFDTFLDSDYQDFVRWANSNDKENPPLESIKRLFVQQQVDGISKQEIENLPDDVLEKLALYVAEELNLKREVVVPVENAKKHITDNKLQEHVSDLLRINGIIAEKTVLDRQKLEMLVEAGLNGTMKEALKSLNINLDEWDSDSQQRIRDTLFGRVIAYSKNLRVPESPAESRKDIALEEKTKNCNDILNLLTESEKKSIEKALYDVVTIQEILSNAERKNEIQKILDKINEEEMESFVIFLAGACYTHNNALLKTIKDNELKQYVSTLLERNGIMVEKTVLDRQKLEILAEAGLNGTMKEALKSLNINLDEWDSDSQQRIQDALFGSIAAFSQKTEFITPTPINADMQRQEEERKKQNRNVLIDVLNLLTPEEKNKLIEKKDKEDIESIIEEVIRKSTRREEIERILNTAEDKNLQRFIPGVCYIQQDTWKEKAQQIFEQLPNEEKMLIAQGKPVTYSSGPIEGKEFIIGYVTELCKEMMLNLSVKEFCDIIFNRLSQQEKIQIGKCDSTVKNVLNINSNEYYKAMFEKYGDQIEDTIVDMCWDYLQDDGLVTPKTFSLQTVAESATKLVKKMGKSLAKGCRKFVKWVQQTQEEFDDYDDYEDEEEIEPAQPKYFSGHEGFASRIKDFVKNPRAGQIKDFAKNSGEAIKDLIDKIIELDSEGYEPGDDDDQQGL